MGVLVVIKPAEWKGVLCSELVGPSAGDQPVQLEVGGGPRERPVEAVATCEEALGVRSMQDTRQGPALKRVGCRGRCTWGLPGGGPQAARPAVVAEAVLCRRISGGLLPGDARVAQAEALQGGEAEPGPCSLGGLNGAGGCRV